jgi:sugar lactone lactonase YvrE
MTEGASVWAVGAQLGEGPVWADGALWFVDIKRRKIHRFDPAGGEGRSWDTPEQTGFLLPAQDGGFVAGTPTGLSRFEPASGAFSAIVEVEGHLPDNRINDGVADPAGRIWFGTMDNLENSPTGRFYRFEGGRVTDAGLAPVTITNGPAVSPDGRILYVVDTLAGTIRACEIGPDGNLGPPRDFVHVPPGEGHPDGPAVDAEGCVWVGVWGGWEARRYSPAGELVGRVRFPAANITKVAFGGADLRTLYATSARQGLTPEQLAAQPEAGNLFAAQVSEPGLASPLVRLP